MNPDNSHPPVDATELENPDRCPFCGASLRDEGAGFMDHAETADSCRSRFVTWLENISDDMGRTWTG